MTQTERTITEINTALQDNEAGDISPEDMRDAVGSAMGGYAAVSLAGSPAVLAAVQQTPLVITQYDTLQAQSSSENADGADADEVLGQLTAGVAGVYAISFYASYSLNQNNRLTSFQAFLNGIAGEPNFERFVSTGADVGEIAATGIVTLAQGDTVEVRVSQDSGSADFTFNSVGLNMHRVG